MAMNNIEMLSDFMFEELERLNNIDLSDDGAVDQLQAEIRRAKQVGNIACEIRNVAKLALEAKQFAAEYAGVLIDGHKVTAPKMLKES